MHLCWSRRRQNHGDGDDPGGLSAKEWRRIVGLLLIGLSVAAVLLFAVPSWLVSDRDYRCPPPPATGQLSPSCMVPGAAGGVDHRALSEARAGARVPFGVFSAALLAGTAAAIGVIVSSHNARLTHRALTATSKANTLTEQRDRDTAARERERAADDRYTTAIEQLGHPSASVRLGGMHSLHRLALGDPERLPTVVDVLCAYLRQPFHHPDHDWNPSEHAPDAEPPARAWWPASQKERDERDSEREVRSTATRLMPELLPRATPPLEASDAPEPLEINLNGAMLDGLELSGRHIDHLHLNSSYIASPIMLGSAHLGSLWLHDAHINGELMLVNVHISGKLSLGGAHIDGLWLIGTRIYGVWLGVGAHIDGDLRLGDGTHIDGLLLADAHITGNLQLEDGAHIDGQLHLFAGAHVDGDLRLGAGAHIDMGLILFAGAHIAGQLLLGDGAYIGGLSLSDGTHIDGDLRLGDGAHIDGDLRLGDGAHIDGDLRLGPRAYITGNLRLEKGAVVQGLHLHAEAAVDASRVEQWGVPLL